MNKIPDEWENKSGIYKLSAGGHIYIGSSKNLRQRLLEHRIDLLDNKHSNRFLQNVFNKYGITNFDVSLVEFCDPEIRLQREKYWIDKLHADMNLQDPLTKKFTKQSTIDKISKNTKEVFDSGKGQRKYDKNPIECYDYFGNYIKSFENKEVAARSLGVDKRQIADAASGYRKGVTIRGKRLRYSDSKVPVQKFDVNPQFLGRYFDFYYLDENNEEQKAFSGIKDFYGWLSVRLKNGDSKITIIPKLKKCCEPWNVSKNEKTICQDK